jgi:putative protease
MITSKITYDCQDARRDAHQEVHRALPELLAPAGNYDALLAALAGGADAVYLGVEDFNARRNADNFTLDTLAAACDLAHSADRRIYLTLNTLVLPDEMERALQIAWEAWNAGVDALIVQDLGLLARLTVTMPQFELHASTQMNLHSAAGVRLAAELGASRVTLARELSLEELAEIAREGVPLEVFAHGALCVCYSGQCLFSSLVGQRSANRGLCAQACRLPYHLIDTSTGRRVKTPGEHLLSPADLATIDILPKLLDAGIASLKIEGRMKSAAYVAVVTRAYRDALDALRAEGAGGVGVAVATGAGGAGVASVVGVGGAAGTGGVGVADAEGVGGTGVADAVGAAGVRDTAPSRLGALAETFSRGFTTAYLEGERGNSMMSYTQPNNRGVAVGRVGALESGMVGVDLTKRVVRGDLLEFRTSRGRSVVTLEEFWGTASSPLEESSEKTRIYLRVPEPVSVGDRVFRVRSAELADGAEATFGNTVFQGNNGLIKLSAQVIAHLQKELEIRFSTRHQGRIVQATARGPVVEAARTKALTEDEIREHVGRVGGTPFFISAWDIQLDEGVGMGFSALHRLRAEALEALTDTLLSPWRKRTLVARDRPPVQAPARKGKPRVAALVRDAAGAKAAAQEGAELIYLHTLRFEATDETGLPTVGRLPGNPPIIRMLPAITRDKDSALLAAASKEEYPVAANNLGEIESLRDGGRVLEAGPSLGVCNSETLDLYARLGLSQAWLSPELSHRDIMCVSPTATLPLTLTIAGRQEAMITEHCLLMAQGPCDQRCAVCARRKAPRLLEDRKGYRLPVRTDDAGRSHLYNAVPLDLVPSMPELVSLGISTFVVDGTLLTTRELRDETTRAIRARDLAIRGAGSLPKREGYTTGHFFRGVL